MITLHRAPIAELVIDRPKVNAMSQAFLEALAERFEEISADAQIKGVLVRARGRCFSAGLDLAEVLGLDAERLDGFLDAFDRAFTAAFRCPKPVAVAVAGHAIAGGLVLALAADHLVLGEGDYKIGLTELQVGVPFPESALRIVDAALPARAVRHLVFGAGTMPPAEAFERGVGDALAADPVAAARSWLETTCARPQSTFRIVKARLRAPANALIDADAGRAELVAALTAPAVRAALRATLRPARPAAPRLLLVENHPGFLHAAGHLLPDYRLEAQPSVAGALAADGPFVAALVDYDLDDGKGDAVVRALRERTPALPIIAISARDLGNERLIAAGADRTCSKMDFRRIGAVLADLLP